MQSLKKVARQLKQSCNSSSYPTEDTVPEMGSVLNPFDSSINTFLIYTGAIYLIILTKIKL